MKIEKKSSGKIASTRNFISKLLNYITNLPDLIQTLIRKVLDDLILLRNNMRNMANANINIGIYHMESKNWKDAVLRFNFVRKFLDKGNKEATFYLAWCNLFMGNKDKALSLVNESLSNDASEKASVSDKDNTEQHMHYTEDCIDNDLSKQELHMMKLDLKHFIEKIDYLDEIPQNIEKFTRNILTEDFVESISNDARYLPTEFVNEINNHIIKFPDQYKILELGSNIGALSVEMRKRMPDEFHLTCVEGSGLMIEVLEKNLINFANNSHNNQNNNISDSHDLRYQFVREYLNQNYKTERDSFNLVVSFNGFGFSRHLTQVFSQIHNVLKSEGHFAFTTKLNNVSSGLPETQFRKNIFEFTHESNELLQSLKQAGFIIELERNLVMSKNKNLSIFIAKKP